MSLKTGCRHFSGYKPCGKSEICDELCPSYDEPTSRLLFVHLEALGAVLRSTALLPAIRRKFPGAHITWATRASALPLLAGNPLVNRAIAIDGDGMLTLAALRFDAAFVLDKSLVASGIVAQVQCDLVYGFVADPASGAIMPATDAARELWEIGLSDRRKFHENKKPETQLACEALELGPWLHDEYLVCLSSSEKREAAKRRAEWAPRGEKLIGLNTGCSPSLPHKKLSVEGQREIVRKISAMPGLRVVLLGGKEDRLRNERIAHGVDVAQSPTDVGIRDGLISVEACDSVITGDSLGLHMAIALRKRVAAWFGPSCAHEIDLYGRGRAIMANVACAPCWKRSCEFDPMCYDRVSIDELINAALESETKFCDSEALQAVEL